MEYSGSVTHRSSEPSGVSSSALWLHQTTARRWSSFQVNSPTQHTADESMIPDTILWWSCLLAACLAPVPGWTGTRSWSCCDNPRGCCSSCWRLSERGTPGSPQIIPARSAPLIYISCSEPHTAAATTPYQAPRRGHDPVGRHTVNMTFS